MFNSKPGRGWKSISYLVPKLVIVINMVHADDTSKVKHNSLCSIGYARGDSMIFNISWAADPCRPGTVWFRSGMVSSY